MKLLRKHLQKDNSGSVRLQPQSLEDLWHIYNLVRVGDKVKSSTIRRIVSTSETGSTSSKRTKMNLEVKVSKIDFQPGSGELRINGTTVEDVPNIKRGSYHTITLNGERPFTLSKEKWDIVTLDRLHDACAPHKSAEIAALVMQEGLGHLFLVNGSLTILRSKIDSHIVRKSRGDSSRHERSIQRFFELVLQAFLKEIDFDVVKVVIIASPGFTKGDFHSYLFDQAGKRGLKTILSNKNKFLLVRSSSGFKSALREILENPDIRKLLIDTQALEETAILDDFFSLLEKSSTRVCYGTSDTFKALEFGAIDKLLISDQLFRSHDPAKREKFVKLVEDVKKNGGKVHIFSSLHPSGQTLNKLTGVACLLRFHLDWLEEEEFDSEDSLGDSASEDENDELDQPFDSDEDLF